MLAGVKKCLNCGYRPTPWEVRNARRMTILKILFGILIVAAVGYVVRSN